MHFAFGQQRLIRNDPADLVFADQVFRRDNSNDALDCFGFAGVDACKLSVSDRRIKNTRIQRPLDERNVVQINGLAADVGC